MGVATLSRSCAAFAAIVGRDGPVCAGGGRTQWTVGGLPAPGTRIVGAPVGVVSHQPAEMIVRVGAGTPVESLAGSLAEAGQMVPLPMPGSDRRATVGGVLAVGHSSVRRLRYGPIRDTVLEVTFVTSEGKLAKAGGPVVKNVTGYDLCRLMVGSLGTLGLLAEVVLRCYPIPAISRWFCGAPADPFDLAQRLYRSSAVLWDGTATWVLLEGHPDDVASQAGAVLGPAFEEVESGPVADHGRRLSAAPDALKLLSSPSRTGTGWLAEVGVGVVHTGDPALLAGVVGVQWPPRLDPRVAELHRTLKQRFDPACRLNPGRSVPA